MVHLEPPSGKEVQKINEAFQSFQKRKADVVKHIEGLARSELSSPGKKVLGIFGSYTSMLKPENRTGRWVINWTARHISGWEIVDLVITGDAVYLKDGNSGRVVKDSDLHTLVKQFISSDIIGSLEFSEILAKICNFGIFLITNDRSAALYEERAFHYDVYGDKCLGVGVCLPSQFSEETLLSCGHQAIILGTLPPFYPCTKLTCQEKCPFRESVKSVGVEIFVKPPFMRLVAAPSWKYVPHIFRHFLNELK